MESLIGGRSKGWKDTGGG